RGRGSPSSKPGMLSLVGVTLGSTWTCMGGSGGLGCPQPVTATTRMSAAATLHREGNGIRGSRKLEPCRTSSRAVYLARETVDLPRAPRREFVRSRSGTVHLEGLGDRFALKA